MDFEIHLPKYTETSELGEKGVRMIADAVEDEMHWIFRPTTKTDVGIDGEIEYKTDDRKCTGKLMAVQIKCGQSYFKEPTSRGYIFRCRPETVNYWLSLSIPVILCLCNNITNKIYWCHITVETIQKLEASYKILIPYENEFNKDNQFKLEKVFDSVIPIQSIVDAAIFIHLHERYKNKVQICPVVEEPRDFHNLSYIINLNDRIYVVGTVIDRYGYFDENEILEKIRLYQENRISCGWGHSRVDSKFMVFFVSESAKNLKLQDSIVKLLANYKSDITYERLLLSREFISASLVSENGDLALTYDNNGTGEFESYGHNVFDA